MKKMLLLAAVSLMLIGCAATKFTYSFDRVYQPLPGETAYDPAPWPH